MDDLTQAVETCDLPALVAELYPESRAQPGRADTVFAVWRGNANSPACSLYRQEGVWLWADKATGESGNAYDFLTQVCGLSGREAASRLKARAGIVGQPPSVPRPPRPQPRPKEPAVKAFVPKPLPQAAVDAYLERCRAEHKPAALAGRGFTAADMEDLLIVDEGGDALFPLLSPEARMVGIKRRYHRPQNGRRYGYEVAGHGSPPWVSPNIAGAESIYIVEGELNAMIAYSVSRQYGGDAKTAFMGAAGAEGRLYREVLADKAVYVHADADPAGDKARARWLAEAAAAGARKVVSLDRLSSEDGETRDFCDIAGEQPGGRKALFWLLGKLAAQGEVVCEPQDRMIATYAIRELRQIAKNVIDGVVTVPTGFAEIDAYTLGLPVADITLVGALPSTGKSAYLRQLLLRQLESPGAKVMLFSPDQSVPDIMLLTAVQRSGIPLWRLQRRQFTPEMLAEHGSPEGCRKHWGAVYDDCLLHLSKRFILSEEQEVEKLLPAIERGLEDGVGMFGFDYLQILEGDDSHGRSLENKAIKFFKRGVQHWKVPLVFAVQLAKSKFDNRKTGFPMMSDIEGHGIAGQAAAQVHLLYNQDIYMRERNLEAADYEGFTFQDTGRARVYIAKNKLGPRSDWFYLKWNADFSTFSNITE